MMGSLLLSRVLGIVRDMVMAWKFGQNDFTDAYVLAFQIPDLLFYMVAGGAFSSAFIPVFSEYWHTDRREEAWEVFGSVVTVMALAVALFIVGAWVYALPLAHWVAPGRPDLAPLIADMSRILLPAQFAFFVGGLMMGTLYARQVFAVPGLGPNVYNLGIIAGAVVLSQFVEPGVVGMAWGALIGAVVGNLVIPGLAMARLGSRFPLRLSLRHPGARKVFRLMAPVVLGLSLPGVFAMITRGFGSLYGVGGLNTALETANRLMQAPLGVFGQSLALAAFPALAQFYAQSRMDLYRRQLAETLKVVVYLSAPVAALLIALAGPLVRVVFEHGAFTRVNTEMTAACLRMFAIGIVAWCVHPVLMRAFFALQRTALPIVMGTVTTGVFVALSYAFWRLGMSYTSLALAGSIAAFVLAGLLLVGMRRVVEEFDAKGLLVSAGKAVVAAAAPAVGLAFSAPLLMSLARWPSLAATAGLALAYAWVYYAATTWLGMEQTETVRRALRRLDRRGGGEVPSNPDVPPEA